MKTLVTLSALVATPALAHPASAAGHMPHWAYVAVVVSLGVALAVRNALKG